MSTSKPEGKEVELAAALVRYLQWCGHEVHQEVKLHDRVADLVVRQGRLLHVIECKVTFSFPVVDQAVRWLGYAHLVSVAVPPRTGYGRGLFALGHAARGLLTHFGLGLWRVPSGWMPPEPNAPDWRWSGKPGWHPDHGVPELEVHPRFHRHLNRGGRKHELASALNEHTLHRSTAGAQAGHVWTPFKRTCEAVAKAVADKPGMTTREVVDSVKHHYDSDGSARGSLMQWARAGKMPGVRLEGERPVRWYPKESE